MQTTTHPHPHTAAAVLAAAIAATPNATPTPAEFAIRDLPASCRLLPRELRKREATLLAKLRHATLRADALTDGYALLLPMSDETLKLASDVIAVERHCCPFLQFRLTIAQESRALQLEFRGPSGSRELLAQVLGFDAAPTR